MLHKYFFYTFYTIIRIHLYNFFILFTADNHVTGHVSSAKLAPPLGINRHLNP